MFRPRIIPALLLKGDGLVKTKKFSNDRYIGDPINAVKIFNDLVADELIFLDILASKEKRTISLDFVKKVGEEANMPFAVGGGIRTISDIRSIINAGAEKVILNTSALTNSEFVKEASDYFGSSTIVVCIDVKENFFGKKKVRSHSGRKHQLCNPIDFAKEVEDMGAGEIVIQSIDRDGMMKGYDLDLLRDISSAVTIPIVALGGAGNIEDLKSAVVVSNCTAVAAGSMFVYHGARNGVLINYLNKKQKEEIRYE
jgi:imidazole glycerol-phosphate synthase subunit HisF